jgi:aspartyl protease family protein
LAHEIAQIEQNIFKHHMKKTLIFIALCAALSSATAQKVALTGVMGDKGLLVIDGASPKLLSAGQTHAGVKLLSASGDLAVLEIGGKRENLRVGQAPVSVGGGTSVSDANKIVLPVGSGGHFMANGSINGKAIQFMVDTGATAVAIGINDAQRMGIDYQKGKPISMNTANGITQGWRVVLRSVRVGEVELFDVEGVVGPNMPFALLGNTFLGRFSMLRTSDTMTLERRF